MTPEKIIATLTAVLAAEPDPAFDTLRDGGYDDRYPVTIEECQRPLPVFEIEGKTIICGRVDVPENHDADNGVTVPLAFAVLRTYSESPAPDPIVYLHGGPGGSAVQQLELNTNLFEFLRGRRDIVLFDQRAGGISDRTVACHNERAEGIVDFAKPGEDQFAPDGSLARCFEEVVAAGVDLSLYNTHQNAKDVRAIADALGYPVYNAFGISYGTKLAQELMRAAPEGLRSVVIDSISRIDNPAYDTNLVPPDQALGWIVDLCAEDVQCAEAFPDLEATINTVGKQLAENPLTVGGQPTDARWFSKFLEVSNGHPEPFSAYLPQIVTEFASGKTTTVEKVLAGAFAPAPPTPASVVGPHEAALDEQGKAIAHALVLEAQQLEGIETSVDTLLAALEEDLSPLGSAAVESMLDQTLSGLVAQLESDELISMAQDYARFIGQEPDRDDIEAFLRAHVPDPLLPRVLGILAAMTHADVAAFYARAEADAARLTSAATMHFALGIIACQEDFPFNSREGFAEVAETFRFPLIAADSEGTLVLYEFCDLFEPQPREGFHEPVVSDIPTLAMAGQKDVQTNPDAAEKAVRTLSNAYAFTFPGSGHGVVLFSQCARDIAEAFIENPAARPNDTCIEGLTPRFLLPDGTFSDG